MNTQLVSRYTRNISLEELFDGGFSIHWAVLKVFVKFEAVLNEYFIEIDHVERNFGQFQRSLFHF